MIADLIESTDIRLITKNVMSVYSTNKEYTDSFIRYLKTHNYLVNNVPHIANDLIGYNKKTYNIYENIYRFAKRHTDINLNKFIEYLNFLDLGHILLMHFYQLDNDTLSLIESLLQLSTYKPIVIIDYIDNLKYKDKIYSLLFHIGLDDRLIIVPFTNIQDAVNNSTWQCYVKSPTQVKTLPRFSNEFLNHEFNTHTHYYTGNLPVIYHNPSYIYSIQSYKYTLYEIFLIFLFAIKLYIIKFNNWRLSYSNLISYEK